MLLSNNASFICIENWFLCLGFKDACDSSEEAYKAASAASDDILPPTNPVLLGNKLNYSVFKYEIRNKPEDACKLAKEVRLAQMNDDSSDNNKWWCALAQMASEPLHTSNSNRVVKTLKFNFKYDQSVDFAVTTLYVYIY